jgi:HEAT repeat protein
MKIFIVTLFTVLCAANLTRLRAEPTPKSLTVRSDAEAVVEQMRGMNMQAAPIRSDGTIDRLEQRRRDIIKQLRAIGKAAVPALVHMLQDADVQMRRNAELAMIDLAGAYDGAPKVDIREATPALIEATEDGDAAVRAWAAHALAEIGPHAKGAVPALIKLASDSDEGCRNDSCMALGRIGPAAKDALPALRKALGDGSADVRRFAQQAIKSIQSE